MKPIHVKAPTRGITFGRSIFLAGSIEMGVAEYWQARFVNNVKDALKDLEEYITFLNPRRDDWDSSWTQELNNAQFYDQVTWELDHLDKADIIALYFDPNTKSPISLLELGLYADSGKLIVCCPDGFWRKGNVDIVCQRYGIPVFTNEEAWMKEIYRRIV